MIKELNKSLKCITEKDDIEPFLTSLKAIINTGGKTSMVLKKTGMSKEQLRDILENDTDFYFDDAIAILKALGCKMTIETLS
jgi:DNA-binding phage protein